MNFIFGFQARRRCWTGPYPLIDLYRVVAVIEERGLVAKERTSGVGPLSSLSTQT